MSAAWFLRLFGLWLAALAYAGARPLGVERDISLQGTDAETTE